MRTPLSAGAPLVRAGALVTALTAAALAWPVAPLSAQTARDDHDETERPEVRDVRFEGVRALDDGELREAIATKPSACRSLIYRFTICPFTKSAAVYERRYLDRTELARDVVRLLVVYYKRGWRDAAVDTAVARLGPRQVRVTFRVTERRPTRVASLAVAEPTNTLRPRLLARLAAPDSGEPLDLLRLDSTVVRLREAYWNRGYGNAVVERPALAVDDSADTAGVRIAVRRGPLTSIGSIDIVHLGPQREISDETIRRSLSVEPGDLFRRSDVAQSQRALYESGLFRSALIDTAVAAQAATGATVCAQQASTGARPATPAAAAAPDSVKNLVVCVTEGPLREARTSAGFTTADFFQLEGRFTHYYWLGGARRLDVSGVVGNLGARQLFGTWPFSIANGFTASDNAAQNALAQTGPYFAPTYQAGVDVRQRWFGSPRNTIGAGAFLHRRSSPGVFVDRGQGVSATFTRTLAERLPASASYRFEVNRVEAGDIYFCVNYGVCDALTTGALAGRQRLSPLALTASANTANDPFSPTRGVLARFEAEHASRATFSDFRYNRLTAEASAYRRLPFRRAVLALHARGGWVDALAGTNAAVGVRQAVDAGGEVLHPRKRFYAGGSQSVRGFGENQLGPRVLTVSADAIRGRTEEDGQVTYEPGCAPPADVVACFLLRREAIGDDQFTPRPLGGTVLAEGNIELRVPVWKQLWGAVFLDGAMLGERTLRDIGTGTGALTPGFGVRYHSPVGPVRVDLGIQPKEFRETLPVVTEEVDPVTGARRLVELAPDGCRESPLGCVSFPQSAAPGGLKGFAQRITLHLSIGEAF